MRDRILEVKNLSAGYGDRVIAKDISFSLYTGGIVSLIGPNGSGKTTILKTLAGFQKPLGGQIEIKGRSFDEVSQKEKSRIMSVMMTERMATDQMTVKDLVSIGRFPYTDMLGRLSDEDNKIVEDALNKVGLLDLSEKVYNDLSDGQKQRALLARAISQGPELMILDEPTSYLDIYHKLRFIDILKDLAKEEDIGILMSVHELEIAFEVSDRIMCLGEDGEFRMIGTPSEVFSDETISSLYNLDAGRLTKMYGGFLDAVQGEIVQDKTVQGEIVKER